MTEQNRRILYSRDKIAAEVKRLGQEISRDYGEQEIMLVGVLKGSFLFIADLIREIESPSVVDFVRLASYGSGTQTSSFVKNWRCQSGTVMLLLSKTLSIAAILLNVSTISYYYNNHAR